MDDSAAAIEKELDEKSIERTDQPKKKTKKKRSAAQIAAFENARAKRADKIAARKKIREEENAKKKQIKNDLNKN